MNAYTPQSLATVWMVAAVWAAVFVSGLLVFRNPPRTFGRTLAWMFGIAAMVLTAQACRYDPAGVRMVAIILVLFYAMKNLATVEGALQSSVVLPPVRWLFFMLWPGMRPSVLAVAKRQNLGGIGVLMAKGSACIAAGVVAVLAARFLGNPLVNGFDARNIAGLVLLMVGFSLMIHFGFFSLLAAAWRLAGFDTRALFRAPLRAQTLAEFWGRRWNLAYSEMIALCIVRPVARHASPAVAAWAAFLFSGVLHELAISVPVRAGYGLPTLYFLLQAAVMQLEPRYGARRPRTAKCVMAATVLLPLPLLFHPPFLREVLIPLL